MIVIRSPVHLDWTSADRLLLQALVAIALSGCSPCKPDTFEPTLPEIMAELVCRPVSEEETGSSHIRVDGCGLISLSRQGGFGGGEDFFDQRSGKRTGQYLFTDTVEKAYCDDFQARTGETPKRDSATCPERAVYQCSSRGMTVEGEPRAPTEGCRAPSAPGCSTCCRHMQVLGLTACEQWAGDASGRYVRETQPSFNFKESCAADCAPCADCRLSDVEQLEKRPMGCSCVDEAAGGDAEAARSVECRSFCSESVAERSACRGVEL